MDTKTDTDNHFYYSDDLLTCSFLLCKQAQLVDITVDLGHFTFVFRDPKKCKELANEFLNNGVVIARELFSRREELLGLMKNRDRNRNNYDRHE